jgi:hypothetical protein
MFRTITSCPVTSSVGCQPSRLPSSVAPLPSMVTNGPGTSSEVRSSIGCATSKTMIALPLFAALKAAWAAASVASATWITRPPLPPRVEAPKPSSGTSSPSPPPPGGGGGDVLPTVIRTAALPRAVPALTNTCAR